MHGLYVASLLKGFFDAGWAIQVLLSDMDRAQYQASRLARPEIERHLLTMSDCAPRPSARRSRDDAPRRLARLGGAGRQSAAAR